MTDIVTQESFLATTKAQVASDAINIIDGLIASATLDTNSGEARIAHAALDRIVLYQLIRTALENTGGIDVSGELETFKADTLSALSNLTNALAALQNDFKVIADDVALNTTDIKDINTFLDSENDTPIPAAQQPIVQSGAPFPAATGETLDIARTPAQSAALTPVEQIDPATGLVIKS